jgi:hypothetical protein
MGGMVVVMRIIGIMGIMGLMVYGFISIFYLRFNFTVTFIFWSLFSAGCKIKDLTRMACLKMGGMVCMICRVGI